ncbi:SAM-dependent methyltransferase [bacterium]|nr:SAM-dependent methyltransferase [bacterium]
MQISLRLEAVASLVENANILIDVGSDHALLPIYLIEKGLSKIVYAIDNKTKPLLNAKKNIMEYGYNDFIFPVLSDGLKTLEINTYDYITIAGMGGETMIDILSFDKLNKDAVLILEPQKNTDLIRKFLMDNNYEIVDELFIKDNDHYYPIIKAIHRGMKIEYSKLELSFGPIILKSKTAVFEEYLNKNISKLESSLKDAKSKTNLLNKINLFKEALNYDSKRHN